MERSLMMGTSLAPVIGYEEAARLAKEAHARNLTIREMALELKILEATALNDFLDPESMTEPAGRPSPSAGKGKRKPR